MIHKKILKIAIILGLFAIHLLGSDIKVGSSEAEVLKEYGQPKSSLDAGEKRIINYETIRITLQNGVVTEIRDIPKPTEEMRSSTLTSKKTVKSKSLQVGRYRKRLIKFPDGNSVSIEMPINFGPFIKSDSLNSSSNLYVSKGFRNSFWLSIGAMPLDGFKKNLSAYNLSEISIASVDMVCKDYTIIFSKEITINSLERAFYHRAEGILKSGTQALMRFDLVTIKNESNFFIVVVRGPVEEFNLIESDITQILKSIIINP